MRTTDFLIIGGGIIGLAVALEAKRRHSGSTVTVLEKETSWGRHASGRNSGVLHAGFYYSADSLKAKLSAEGNRVLTEYCLDRGLPINQCGKLVVTTGPDQLPALDELFRRARANNVIVEDVTQLEARELEPRARTYERALYSPTTSSIDPEQVVGSLVRDAKGAGVELCAGSAFVGSDGPRVRTSTGDIQAGYVINCAGAYADQVAREFGFGEEYTIIPFKGLYLKGVPGERFQMHVYPVPDLRYPFLGVHVTVNVDGTVKLGPSASPAFGREQYGFSDLRISEGLRSLQRLFPLLIRNHSGLRTLAIEEMKKYSRRIMVKRASLLADGVRLERYPQWARPGIRPQLFDNQQKRLVMDFVIQEGRSSCHVLNAISPGFTCALPFAEHVWDRIEAL